jgi:hypothetical protein
LSSRTPELRCHREEGAWTQAGAIEFPEPMFDWAESVRRQTFFP